MGNSNRHRILYHYTDFGALNGILGENELRVNNVLNMNDAEEMQLFMKGVCSSLYERLMSDGETGKALMVQSAFAKIKEKSFEYSSYAACFSTFRDDAAQWERYANKGKGVCLGFDQSVLTKMTGGAVSLQKVYYQDDMKSHPLVEKLHKLIIEGTRNSDMRTDLDETIREAWRSSASFKHPSFYSEHEIRLVVMPFDDEEFDITPRFHVSKERIKKYYPLNLKKMCEKANVSIEDLMTEIIVGPESTQSIPILQDYLLEKGLYRLAENVFHSDCPLRSKLS